MTRKLPPRSDEYKARMSAAKKGKKRTTPVSEETRKKISERRKKYFRDNPDALVKHGLCRRNGITEDNLLYHVWWNMVQRCTNPEHEAWDNYGGRGITVCSEWLTDVKAFLDHMGPRPEGMELDRINNDGGYEPGNVRWTTRSQNVKNSRPRQKDELGRFKRKEDYT